MPKWGIRSVASRQLASVTPKASSIISERSQPGVSATAVRAVRREVLRLGEREPDDRGLGEVVEGVDAVVDGVVLRRAVGHLDHQAARVADQQRERVVAGDQVRLDREVEQPQAVGEVVLPHRRVPLEQLLAAPDVVDEHVEAALLGVDALDERLDLVGLEVVGRDGDAVAAGGRDELGGLLDRLRAVVLRAGGARAAAGAVDGGAGLAERDGDAAAGAAGRAGDERDRAFEVGRHDAHRDGSNAQGAIRRSLRSSRVASLHRARPPPPAPAPRAARARDGGGGRRRAAVHAVGGLAAARRARARGRRAAAREGRPRRCG